MAFDRTRRAGAATNRLIGQWAGRIDDETGAVAYQVARALGLAVRILRIPTLLLLVAPIPFTVATAALAVNADGPWRWIGLLLAGLMTLVTVLFGIRRHRIIRAVDEPEALATEFGIAISLSERVGETRDNLRALTGGQGGWRVFSRLTAAWRTARMPVQWIDSVGDLPRARYFVPPTIGTTVTLVLAALWLVPISVLIAFFAAVGALAGSL